MQHVDRLEKIIKDGDYYGAQQMYKSVSARLKWIFDDSSIKQFTLFS